MVFTLFPEGGAEVLKIMAKEQIDALAQQIAAAAGQEAVVATETTDRARASVTVPAHIQAKDGALSRAATQAGLEFRPRKQRERKKRATSDTPVAKKTRRTTKKKPTGPRPESGAE